MRFVTIVENTRGVPAAVRDDTVRRLDDLLAGSGIDVPVSIDELILNFETYRPLIEERFDDDEVPSLGITDAVLGPCVGNPEKILCVGLNYRKHAIEAKMPIPEFPVLFGKFNNTLAASRQEIDISGLAKVDYESELAVVIGKTARNVDVDDALEHVFGYCNANDLSDRELQLRSGQWLLGKTVDGFLPLGPYLVTRDEVPNPQDLTIRGWLNGDLRQESSTSDMIFSVAEVISYASKYFTLRPGDIIITGTPFGVIMGMDPQEWMKPGDEYSVEIGNLGRLSNRVVSQQHKSIKKSAAVRPASKADSTAIN